MKSKNNGGDMTGRNLILSAIILSTSFSAFAEDTASAKTKPELYGSLYIQAKKYVGTSSDSLTLKNRSKNVDQLCGVAYIGMTFNRGIFSSNFCLYAYPPGYGYVLVTNATYNKAKDSVEEETGNFAGIDIQNAWAKFETPVANIRVGHMLTYQSNSSTWLYGDYIDEDPYDRDNVTYGDFEYRGVQSNVLELTKALGKFTANVSFEAGDMNLNTGNIKVLGDLKPSDKLWFSLGWRINAVDRVQNSKAVLQNRIAATAGFDNGNKLKIYLEPAAILSSDKSVDTKVPILVGLQVPVGKVLDFVALESEIVPNRTTLDKDGKSVKKPVLMNLHIEKSVGEFGLFDMAVFSDAKAPKPTDICGAIRFTAYFGPQP